MEGRGGEGRGREGEIEKGKGRGRDGKGEPQCFVKRGAPVFCSSLRP